MVERVTSNDEVSRSSRLVGIFSCLHIGATEHVANVLFYDVGISKYLLIFLDN